MFRYPVVELRQYTLHDGSRERLVRLFEDEFLEAQEAMGMYVIGPFRDLDDANRFVWFRGFPGMEERRRMLSAFYDGPIWRAHRDTANGTLVDSDNVLLLRPVPMGPANSTAVDGDALVIANIHYVDRTAIESFMRFFEETMHPALTAAGGQVIAAFETEGATNTYSRLPVREGETVFVWLTAFRDARHFEDHLAALRGSPDWREHASVEVLRQFARRPEVLRLAPTPRSRLQFDGGGTREVVTVSEWNNDTW